MPRQGFLLRCPDCSFCLMYPHCCTLLNVTRLPRARAPTALLQSWCVSPSWAHRGILEKRWCACCRCTQPLPSLHSRARARLARCVCVYIAGTIIEPTIVAAVIARTHCASLFQPSQAFSDVYPHLGRATNVPSLIKIADVDFDNVDAVFCCLPHGTTQATLASLPQHIKIVDLSADFRLKDVNVYGEWYDKGFVEV